MASCARWTTAPTLLVVMQTPQMQLGLCRRLRDKTTWEEAGSASVREDVVSLLGNDSLKRCTFVKANIVVGHGYGMARGKWSCQ